MITMDHFIEKLHEKIEEGDMEEIKVLLEQQTINETEHFYNPQMESAAAVALKFNQIEIYEHLLKNDICLGPCEEMQDLGEQPPAKKRKLRDIHREHLKPTNLKHLKIMNAKALLAPDASSVDSAYYRELIDKIFIDLNSSKLLEPILKIASTSKKLKIAFDFNHDSVANLDPMKHRGILGTTYPEDAHIYLGAKENDDNTRNSVLGVLIHELCHFALNLLYDNGCKPYQAEDNERKHEFEQVVAATARKNHTEPFVGDVFNYDADFHHAELIVRAPQLLALYADDDDAIERVSEEYSELYQFYESTTLVDLIRDYPLMEAKRELITMLEGMNRLSLPLRIEVSPQCSVIDLSKINKVLVISSNCPQLTIRVIEQQNHKKVFSESLLIADFNAFRDEHVVKLAADSMLLCAKPKIIINCDGQEPHDVTRICGKFISEHVVGAVFIVDENFSCQDNQEYDALAIQHSWGDLTESFQQELSRKLVSFQGSIIQIGHLINDFSSVASTPFRELFKNQIIKIGESLPQENSEEFIEREFWPPTYTQIYRPPSMAHLEGVKLMFEDVALLAEQNRTILLADKPGMGKSTTFKMVCSKLKEKFANRWIVFIDLKMYCNAYQSDERITIEFKTREAAMEYIRDRILKLNRFEAEVFAHLYSEDRIVVLMDGFDEVCPSFKKFIMSLMVAFDSLTRNQLWISTRPHIVSDLDKLLQCDVFRLNPFTTENRREFLEKFFISRDKDDERIGEKINIIEKYLRKLCDDPAKRKPVTNPLVLKMIAEQCDGDNSLKLSDINQYSIYNEFTKKLVKRCSDKGFEALESVTNSWGNSEIIEFNQKEAFRTCFRQIHFNDIAEPVTSLSFENVQAPSHDEIARIGLMYFDGSEALHFIHKTFAEFYVAKFFYEKIFLAKLSISDDISAILEVFFPGLIDNYDESKQIIKFVDNALETFKVDNCAKRTKTIVGAFVVERSPEIIKDFIRCRSFNIIRSLLYHVAPKHLCRVVVDSKFGKPSVMSYAYQFESLPINQKLFSMLRDIIGEGEMREALLRVGDDGRSVLHHAAGNVKHPEIFDFLSEKIEVLTDLESLTRLLMQLNSRGENIIHIALKMQRDISHICAILSQKLDASQLQSMLQVEVEDENLLLFSSIFRNPMANNVSNIKILWGHMKSNFDVQVLKEFLLQKSTSSRLNFLEIAFTDGEEVFETIKSIYCETFDTAEMKELALSYKAKFLVNVFSDVAQHLRLKSMFVDILGESECKKVIKEMLLPAKNNEKFPLISLVSTLHTSRYHRNTTELPGLTLLLDCLDNEDQSEVLLATNDRGECALNCALSKDFFFLKKLYQTKLGNENMGKVITNGNVEFFLKFLFEERVKGVRDVCHYFLDLFRNSGEEKKLRDFFLNNNQEGESIFMNVVKYEDVKAISIIFELSKKIFDKPTVKEMLLRRNESGETAFHTSLYIERSEVFETVKHVYQQIFEPEEMIAIILTDMKNGNIMSYCAKYSSFRDPSEDDREENTFRNFFNYLRVLFTDRESLSSLKRMLIAKTNEGKWPNGFRRRIASEPRESLPRDTPIIYVIRFADSRMFSCFLSLIDMFDKLEQKEILLQTNDIGQCALHCAPGRHEIYQEVEQVFRKIFDDQEMRKIIISGGAKFLLNWIRSIKFEQPAAGEKFCDGFKALFDGSQEEAAVKKFFSVIDENGETILTKAAELCDINEFEVLVMLSQTLHDSENFEAILKMVNGEGKTAFHVAMTRKRREDFERVKKIYFDKLGTEKLKEMLWTDISGENILFFALKMMTEANFHKFFNFFKKLLSNDKEKVRTLLVMKDVNGELFEEKLNQSLKLWNVKEILLSLEGID